jgi:hypothetical protein
LGTKEGSELKETSMTTILTPRRSLVLLPVLFALVPLPASAAEVPDPDSEVHHEPSFGDARQLAISGATQLQLAHSWSSFSDSAPTQSTSFGASTAVDYFVLSGFSLGARVGYAHFDQPGFPASDSLSLGPRVGYDVRLARQWSFWPDVYAAYGASWGGARRRPTP